MNYWKNSLTVECFENHKLARTIHARDLVRILNCILQAPVQFTVMKPLIGPRGGGGGHLLVNCVPMREQRTTKMRPSQGFWGTRPFISREQGNNGQFLRGTGEQRQYWGTGNIENKFSIFGEQGNKPIYFRGTREQVPPPPPPGRASKITLNSMFDILKLISLFTVSSHKETLSNVVN